MTTRDGAIANTTAAICGWLSDHGFEYHWEADNRGGFNSRYVYVRRPTPAKIRVSDHRSDRFEKEAARSKARLNFDVSVTGKYGVNAADVYFALSA